MTVKNISIYTDHTQFCLFCRVVRITPVWKVGLKSPVLQSQSDCTKYKATEQTEFSSVGFLVSVCETRECFKAVCLSVEAKLNGINCNLFYHLSHTHTHTHPTQKKQSVSGPLGQLLSVDGAVTAVLQSLLFRQVYRHFIIAWYNPFPGVNIMGLRAGSEIRRKTD